MIRKQSRRKEAVKDSIHKAHPSEAAPSPGPAERGAGAESPDQEQAKRRAGGFLAGLKRDRKPAAETDVDLIDEALTGAPPSKSKKPTRRRRRPRPDFEAEMAAVEVGELTEIEAPEPAPSAAEPEAKPAKKGLFGRKGKKGSGADAAAPAMAARARYENPDDLAPKQSGLFSSPAMAVGIIGLLIGAGVLYGMGNSLPPMGGTQTGAPTATVPQPPVTAEDEALASALEPESEALADRLFSSASASDPETGLDGAQQAELERLEGRLPILRNLKSFMDVYTEEQLLEGAINPNPLRQAAESLQTTDTNILEEFLTQDILAFASEVDQINRGELSEGDVGLLRSRLAELPRRLADEIADAESQRAQLISQSSQTGASQATATPGGMTTAVNSAMAAQPTAAPPRSSGVVSQGLPFSLFLLLILLGLIGFYFYQRAVKRDIKALSTSIKEQYFSDPGKPLWGVERDDELGDIAKTVQELRQQIGVLQEGMLKDALTAASGNLAETMKATVGESLGELKAVRDEISATQSRFAEMEAAREAKGKTAVEQFAVACSQAGQRMEALYADQKHRYGETVRSMGQVVEACNQFSGRLGQSITKMDEEQAALSQVRQAFGEKFQVAQQELHERNRQYAEEVRQTGQVREQVASIVRDLTTTVGEAARFNGDASRQVAQQLQGLEAQGAAFKQGLEAKLDEFAEKTGRVEASLEAASKLADEGEAFGKLRNEMTSVFEETARALNEAVESYAQAAEAMTSQADAVREGVARFDTGISTEMASMQASSDGLREMVEKTREDVLETALRLSNRADSFDEGLTELTEKAGQGIQSLTAATANFNERSQLAGNRMDASAQRMAEIHGMLTKALGQVDEKADRLAEIKAQIIRAAEAMDRGTTLTRSAMEEVITGVRQDTARFAKAVDELEEIRRRQV